MVSVMNSATVSQYVPNTTNTPKVNDIWLSTWGYEACIADFYVVTKVTDKSVWLAPIASTYTGGNWAGEDTMPILPIQTKGPSRVHRLRESYYGLSVHRNGYSSIHPWDGRSVHTYNHH